VAAQELIRDHDFVKGLCRWCGGRDGGDPTKLTCVPRWVDTSTRSTPTSIFTNLTSIGDRMREIQAEERPVTPPGLDSAARLRRGSGHEQPISPH